MSLAALGKARVPQQTGLVDAPAARVERAAMRAGWAIVCLPYGGDQHDAGGSLLRAFGCS